MRRRVRARRRARRKIKVFVTRAIIVLLALVIILQVRQLGKSFLMNLDGRMEHTSSIGEVEEGKFPLLLQSDKRWAKEKYGDGNMKENGCAPTSLSMIVAGLTGDDTATPLAIAKYAESNGYYMEGVGTVWDLFTEGIRKFGIEGNEISLSKETVFDALNSGMPIVCSMRPGDFTTKGHIIVLTRTEDGKIRLNDPNSIERSEKLWDYETLEYQIKNLWAFHAI